MVERLHPYEELELLTVDADGFAMRKFIVRAKKHGSLKVLEVKT